MQNTWQRLRQNPSLWNYFHVREKALSAIRQFFAIREYHELDVPLLAPKLPAESYIEIFETKLLDRNREEKRGFLTTSPELFLKKLLVAGAGNCFSLTKSFRNTESGSILHNPEFTLLEWYSVGKTYMDLMNETEELFLFIYQQVYSSSGGAKRRSREVSLKTQDSSRFVPVFTGTHSNNKRMILNYQGQQIDLSPPWERISMIEAFKKYADIILEDYLELEPMQQLAKKKGYHVSPENTWEELFHQIYLNEVEPHFGKGKPTIVYDFPSQMAALAKKKKGDLRFAERFELYIAGLELGDCYSELTDWKEQEGRFKKEVEERKRLGKTEYPYDQDFLDALKVGLPECAGLALGVDRTVMLFANAPKIQDVLYFPAEEMW